MPIVIDDGHHKIQYTDMEKILLDLSNASETTIRSIEELLVLELAELRACGDTLRHDKLAVEIRKLEERLDDRE